MCFSSQRRAIFRHLNFKKWSETVSFLTFSLPNVLLATAACIFSTSERQEVVRTPQFFDILTWKCASRYSGVQFFHIATSKSGPPMRCFVHFDLKMCFSLQRRVIFQHRNFKKWSAHEVFCTFWLENVLLATAACNFSTSQLQKVVRACCVFYILTWNVLLATAARNFSFPSSTATSAPAALTRLLFDPADAQIIEKHNISRLP